MLFQSVAFYRIAFYKYVPTSFSVVHCGILPGPLKFITVYVCEYLVIPQKTARPREAGWLDEGAPELRSGWQNPGLSSWAQRRISGRLLGKHQV